MITKLDKLIILLILIAALASLPIAIKASGSARGTNVLVFNNGKMVATYDLAGAQTIRIKSKGGYCLLSIRSREASIKKSTCPLKICQKQGRISKSGQTIVCAPMGLMYRVESAKKADQLDAVNE